MDYNTKISELLASTKRVIKDCVSPSGAIIAANSFKSYFPKAAKNYKFVWPRDGSYVCMAADILHLDIQEKFFNWCTIAEGWSRNGIFYEKYFVNGRKAADHFQPDQTGIFLMVLCNYAAKLKSKGKEKKGLEYIIRKSANGLSRVWQKDHFSMVNQDIWEERLCFPDIVENFTYSLAACCKGLECANQLYPTTVWQKTREDMKAYIEENSPEHFCRSIGTLSDNRVDASLLGLVWPFQLFEPDDKKMKKTIQLMEDLIVKDYGVYRYEHDEYDGWMYNKNIHRKKGAGYWPLLNFWMSICLNELGDKKKALRYYYKVLDDLPGTYIPEQIFNNTIQVSVSPLAWAHAMFIIASEKLKLI